MLIDCFIFFRVDEALRAQHRKLPGGRPEKTYSELLEKKFTQIVGTPKWSEIKDEDDYSSDSDHEILKVILYNFSIIMF